MRFKELPKKKQQEVEKTVRRWFAEDNEESGYSPSEEELEQGIWNYINDIDYFEIDEDGEVVW